jgi:histone deacetylase 1/2
VILDNPITNNIPYNEFFQYYGPDFKLHLTPSDMPNLNSRDELERTKNRILQNLSSIDHAPSVQMQEIPPDMYLMPEEDQDADPDVRISQAQSDKMVERDEEFYEDDKDQDTH